MKRIAVWSLLIVFLLPAPVLTTETADLIIGTWETTKIIDGKLMTVVYNFRPDGVLEFSAFSDGVVVSDLLAPEIIYAIKDDFLLLSFSSVSDITASIILRIVEINRTTLKIIDIPVNEESFKFIEGIVAGADRNGQDKQGDITILRRKFI